MPQRLYADVKVSDPGNSVFLVCALANRSSGVLYSDVPSLKAQRVEGKVSDPIVQRGSK